MKKSRSKGFSAPELTQSDPRLPALRKDVKLLRMAFESLTALEKRFSLYDEDSKKPLWGQKAVSDTQFFLHEELEQATTQILMIETEAD